MNEERSGKRGVFLFLIELFQSLKLWKSSAQPTKYFFRMVPVAKEALLVTAMFDDDFVRNEILKLSSILVLMKIALTLIALFLVFLLWEWVGSKNSFVGSLLGLFVFIPILYFGIKSIFEQK